jgi:hypothetical protein
MLEAFGAVLIDLFHFVFPTNVDQVKNQVPLLTSRSPVVDAKAATRIAALPIASHLLTAGETAYIIKPNVPCFKRPILAFDSRVGSFSFGNSVTVSTVEGQFAYVSSSTCAGWIDRNMMTYQKSEVFPHLQSGQIYTADDKETIKIRAWLKDECDGASLYLSLQPIEHILYELSARGICPNWSNERPRRPGVWQNLLKGKPRVRIGIEPKTGSIMEYHRDDRTGVLAFVEAVHPDDSIVIQSVGREREGEYLVDSFSERQWRELRAVFISIT